MTHVFGHLVFIRSVVSRLEISVSHIVPSKYKQISLVELSGGKVYALLWIHVLYYYWEQTRWYNIVGVF